eukprot:TRINITY_DN701_c0_g1_i1.p1 TRINITY_DN701_c0_g1~~TRINITY_DN701_c0_g1_i1.p1  ORF type:complete len:323 (+),score=80.29 TRINITY_DN701_c0_g1_i1:347-1315(+)
MTILMNLNNIIMALKQKSIQALEKAQLIPLRSDVSVLKWCEESEVYLSLRVAVPGLYSKENELKWMHQKIQDPFTDSHTELYLETLNEDYYLTLNKYPAVEGHGLMVTHKFIPQFLPLDYKELYLMFEVTKRNNCFTFINIGRNSGASQPHRHMQVLPLPFGDMLPELPLDLIARTSFQEERVFEISIFNFKHKCVSISSLNFEEIFELYLEAMKQLDLPFRDYYKPFLDVIYEDINNPLIDIYSLENVEKIPSYNVIFTKEFLLIVPRKQSYYESIPINSIPFAGSIFVHYAEDTEVFKKKQPIELFENVCFSKNESYNWV